MTDRLTQENMANREVCDDLCDLLHRKNSNYGRNLPRHGLRGVVIRMSDKLMRLENLVLDDNAADEVGETVEDTLMDLAGYAVKALALMRLGDLSLEGHWKYTNGVEGFLHQTMSDDTQEWDGPPEDESDTHRLEDKDLWQRLTLPALTRRARPAREAVSSPSS